MHIYAIYSFFIFLFFLTPSLVSALEGPKLPNICRIQDQCKGDNKIFRVAFYHGLCCYGIEVIEGGGGGDSGSG